MPTAASTIGSPVAVPDRGHAVVDADRDQVRRAHLEAGHHDDQHGGEQQGAAVRAQQRAEQPPRAGPQEDPAADRDVVVLLGRDAAPVVRPWARAPASARPAFSVFSLFSVISAFSACSDSRRRRWSSQCPLLGEFGEIGALGEQVAVAGVGLEQLVVGADGRRRWCRRPPPGRARPPGRRAARSRGGARPPGRWSPPAPSAALPRRALGWMSRAESGSSSTSRSGPAEHSARQREALALAAGQRHALLADTGVESPGQVVGRTRPARPASPRRPARRSRRASHHEVLPHARGEQRRILEGAGDAGTQLG